ncbi:MAG: hypothetical protein ABIB47_05765 [Candidatus Woesearchaeota archaeon]
MSQEFEENERREVFETVLDRVEKAGYKIDSVRYTSLSDRNGKKYSDQLGVDVGREAPYKRYADARALILDSIEGGIHLVPDKVRLITCGPDRRAYFVDMDLAEKKMLWEPVVNSAYMKNQPANFEGGLGAAYPKNQQMLVDIFKESGWSVDTTDQISAMVSGF